jgi:hypothetical protein
MKIQDLKKLIREEVRNAIKENDGTGSTKYYFQGIRYQAGDWDYDDAEITANNEQEAWEQLYKFRKRHTWSGVAITHINDEKLKEPLYNKNK